MRSVAEHRGDALSQLQEKGRCSVPNAALLMDLHHHTLRKYIDEGLVQAIFIGKRPWITAEEIDRYNREGKLTATE